MSPDTLELGAATKRAFYAGRAAERAHRAAEDHDRAKELRQLLRGGVALRARRSAADVRLRALNEAQELGPDAYAAEREKQGLLPYDPRGVWASWQEVAA